MDLSKAGWSMDLSKAGWPIVLGIALMVSTSGTGTAPVLEIGIKNRANAYASFAASGRFVALAWGSTTPHGMTGIYVAVSHDGGRAFRAPSRVADAANRATLSGEQPPRIALVPRSGSDPAIVVVWTEKTPDGTRLLSARSDDAGASFASPVTIPGSEAPGNRGWQSIATGPDGTIAALWLDHREHSAARESGTSTSHAAHQHPATGQKPGDGVARAQLSKLIFSRLAEPDNSGIGVRSAEPPSQTAITGGVCYCCKTAIATDSSGAVYAAWRHVYEGNVRDIAFTKSPDGGPSFAHPLRVSDDRWVLDGCPENGPAMAVDTDKRIHIVWPTLVPGATARSEPTLALFYATSTDGRQFTTRQRVPTQGVPRHPQIAVGPAGAPIVAWDEQAGGTRRIAVARGTVAAGGPVRFVREQIGDTGTRAEYPAIAPVNGGAIVAWTSGAAGQTVLRTQRLSTPAASPSPYPSP
jgi:hypothetical protein